MNFSNTSSYKKSFAAFLFAFVYHFFVIAQSTDYIKGEFLVQLKKGNKINALIEAYQDFHGNRTNLRPIKLVSPPFNIWQIRYRNDNINHHEFLQAISKNDAVLIAQLNHKLKYRATTPNDPGFNNQWQYINMGGSGGVVDADLDADEAWDITTGGVTILGDTIVVAIIDDGIDLTHPDWGDNLWVNRFEIPSNNIDDDNNGYIDDYLGWDADFDNDNVADGGWHGTQLAGIIGAQGNNNTGVSGVNWNVKMMIIQGGGDEAQAISAYSYALTQRSMYNNTNGAKGAFVVATNSSWGLDFQDPSSAPLWCAFYDSMGAEGILSAAATTNSNADVDVVGDLPTTCPSDFLISVTNVGRDDNHEPSGYGATSIDLGAYGEDVWTVNYGGGYAPFGGTSGAAPHVAGAVGLLYAAPCPSLISLSKTDPALAALFVKQYILDGVDSNASLAGITVTGGKLNLFKAITELLNNCSASSCIQPFSVRLHQRTDTSAIIKWSSLSASSFNTRFRQTNGTWLYMPTNVDSLVISGLSACTDYEFEVEAICGTDSSGFAPTFTFTTDGCCEPPSTFFVGMATDSSAMLNWNQVLAALSYNLRYKPVNSSFWITETGLTANALSITNLNPCTAYEFQVQTICSGSTTGYSNSHEFNTVDCGSCESLNYCNSSGDAQFEWIEAVSIGALNNISGNNGGYGDFTNSSISFTKGDTIPVTLTPGFSFTDDEYFVVWIDFNQDGDFDDIGEEAFDAGFASVNPASGTIVIPQNAQIGSTRMRVSMQWQNKPNACDGGMLIYGEVEDYCVSIIDTLSCPDPVAGYQYNDSLLSVAFSDTSLGATSWNWNFGDGNTDTLQNPVHLYADTGQYDVCLIALNDCGADTFCQTISVTCPLPIANFQSVDSLLQVSFLNSSTNATNILWNFGDGDMDTTQNPIHIYPDTGSYDVCLIASNSCGFDTICKTISLTCPYPIASFQSTDSLFYVAFQNLSSNASSYLWDFGDGLTDSASNPTHTYSDTGLYNACLIVENDCGSDTLCKPISINCPLPIANFSSIDSLLTVDFMDLSSGAIDWSWNFGDGTISAEQNPVHAYLEFGIYWACLTVSNLCGTSSFCDSLNIVLTDVHPNYADQPLAYVYPNPFNVKTYLYFNDQTGRTYSIELSNTLGKRVLYMDNIQTDKVEIDGRNLAGGIYLFRIINTAGFVSGGKIILK